MGSHSFPSRPPTDTRFFPTPIPMHTTIATVHILPFRKSSRTKLQRAKLVLKSDWSLFLGVPL